MNTIELILVILVIMVVVGGIILFSKGSKIAFLSQQEKTGGKLMKYLPVIMVAFFLAFLLYTNIYVRNNKETVNNLDNLKFEIKKIESNEDTLALQPFNWDTAKPINKPELNNLDTLYHTQKKLYQLMDQVEKEKYLTGYSNVNPDSLQKLIYLTNHEIQRIQAKRQ